MDNKLAFGFMRLPTNSDDLSDVNYDEVSKMVDLAMENGFNYFDTGYGYHDGNSEVAIKKCVVDRYPREDVQIADKLPIYDFDENTNQEEIFAEQLERCGVDYFDYYLLHAMTDNLYEGVVKSLDSFGFVRKLKEEGKIKHIGLSHHDNADVLDKVLTEHPEVEFVLLQLNYLDWNNPAIQSRKCYKVARKHNVDVMVMEPLKGGTLVNIPAIAEEKLVKYNPDLSIASWGVRFAASREGVVKVLSGMSNMEQIEDNISYMKEFEPLTKGEEKVLRSIRKIIENSIPIPCTSCEYCLAQCPESIPISRFFSLYNDAKQAIEVQYLYYIYYNNDAEKGSPASACTQCGECEKVCTQHLDIIDGLVEVKNLFEISEE